MGNPWDRPPFPKDGNVSQRVLFESIGRALMAWEEVEGSLAHLYSAISTGSQFDEPSNKAYGNPDNFRERLGALRQNACRYFVKNCDQHREGQFAKIAELAEGFSGRRNDIAHGRARPIQWILGKPRSLLGDAPFRWCIIPPHFRGNKFTPGNVPHYVLTSREINVFAGKFWDVAVLASDLARKLETPQPPLRGISFPPLA